MIPDDDKELLNSETYYPFDSEQIRKSLMTKTLNSLEKSFPVEWGGIRLEIKNLRYDNDKPFTIKQQKDSLLKNNYLSKDLKGDVYLYNSETNQLLDSAKNKILMHVPYYTQRGTFIHNGNEYSTLKQVRLRPGVYSRKRSNGELESQFNIQRGTGIGYRITLTPSTGIYKISVGQSSVNLYSILHDLGIDDKELENAWGKDILYRNKAQYDSRSLPNLYTKLVGKPSGDITRNQMVEGLRNAFNTQMIDEDIKIRNLG